jgi:hypothetical protein
LLAPCGIPSFSVGAIQSTERLVTSICRSWVLTQRLPPRATWSTVPTRSARSAAAWRPRPILRRGVLLQKRGPRLRQPGRPYYNEQTGTSERVEECPVRFVAGNGILGFDPVRAGAGLCARTAAGPQRRRLPPMCSGDSGRRPRLLRVVVQMRLTTSSAQRRGLDFIAALGGAGEQRSLASRRGSAPKRPRQTLD